VHFSRGPFAPFFPSAPPDRLMINGLPKINRELLQIPYTLDK